MFNVENVRVLNEGLDVYEAQVKRRYNGEKNDGIRELLSAEILKCQEARVVVNNPKLVTK